MATQKFDVNGSQLKKALQIIYPAMQGKIVIPVNECVLFTVEEEGCWIMGTNTSITATSQCPCVSKESFESLIPFKQLYALSSKVGNKKMTIEVGKNISVKVEKEEGKHQFGVAVDVKAFTRGRDFTPDFELAIDDGVLWNLQQAMKAVDLNHGNPAFHNVWIDIRDRKLRIIGTTGNWFFRHLQEIDDNITFSGMVSVGFVKALAGLTGAIFESDGKSVRIRTDNASITVVLGEQKVPNTDPFFPERKANCHLSKDELLEALDMITIYEVPEGWREVSLSFAKKNKMLVKFDHEPTSQFYEKEIDVKHSVTIKETVHFNVAYIKNLLSLFPESVKQIDMVVTAHNKQVNFDSKDDVSINGVVAPTMNVSENTKV
jgi:DNA polymerase III sliding clamp (beta) subunit (PCNA family)